MIFLLDIFHSMFTRGKTECTESRPSVMLNVITAKYNIVFRIKILELDSLLLFSPYSNYDAEGTNGSLFGHTNFLEILLQNYKDINTM